MTVFEFVDELPSGSRGIPVAKSREVGAFAKALRDRGGQWAVAPWSDRLAWVSRRNSAYHINHHNSSAYKPLRFGFEAAVRDKVLYIRYVGES